MKKLNLGCGNDIRKGYVNLDIAKLKGVDIVHNINKLPLPFQDNYFDEILCLDILEHVDSFIDVFQDLNRILKKKGVLVINVPHFTSSINYTDPTHKNIFSIRKFEFFVKNSKYWKKRNYYFNFTFSKINKLKITFTKNPLIYNIPIEIVVNSAKHIQYFFEDSFLSRVFPATGIYVEIEK